MYEDTRLHGDVSCACMLRSGEIITVLLLPTRKRSCFWRTSSPQVHHIHHMMTVLLVFKTLSMLFESIRYHYLRLTGAAEAWSIVYYLFAFLKGITLFVVVLLIGTGWSLIKPFLNNRDKQIIVVVLSLQVSFLPKGAGTRAVI